MRYNSRLWPTVIMFLDKYMSKVQITALCYCLLEIWCAVQLEVLFRNWLKKCCYLNDKLLHFFVSQIFLLINQIHVCIWALRSVSVYPSARHRFKHRRIRKHSDSHLALCQIFFFQFCTNIFHQISFSSTLAQS